MRNRFVDPKDENYVFLAKYHKRIPADGISQYMSSVWVSSTLLRLSFASSLDTDDTFRVILSSLIGISSNE